jgi:hypothetical protein
MLFLNKLSCIIQRKIRIIAQRDRTEKNMMLRRVSEEVAAIVGFSFLMLT